MSSVKNIYILYRPKQKLKIVIIPGRYSHVIILVNFHKKYECVDYDFLILRGGLVE